MDIFLTAGQLAKGSDEDCLFVHVFTKKLPTSGYKYPVLVNFHGGGYAFGTGNKEAQSPDYFMSHNIVYVSVNYRLGPLGKCSKTLTLSRETGDSNVLFSKLNLF